MAASSSSSAASIAFFARELGPEVDDADEETFLLFAQEIPSQNLGFIDPAAATIEVAVAGRELTISQSPGILSSTRSGGTTGAEWISHPSNVLFRCRALSRDAAVLELGCGVSAVVGLALAPAVASYTLTDQPYVARLVEQNILQNRHVLQQQQQQQHSSGGRRAKSTASQQQLNLRFAPLDWETDQVVPSLAGDFPRPVDSFDVVVACDCIYNESLIDPLVQTCADACELRRAAAETASDEASATQPAPCVCVVAQQLRDPDIFEGWIKRFHRSFHVWRVPDDSLPEGLRSSAGFVVHIGILR